MVSEPREPLPPVFMRLFARTLSDTTLHKPANLNVLPLKTRDYIRSLIRKPLILNPIVLENRDGSYYLSKGLKHFKCMTGNRNRVLQLLDGECFLRLKGVE